MLRDHKLVFSDSQQLSSAAVTNVTSTNVLDMGPLASGNTVRNLGASDLYLVGRIEATPTSTGSATLSVKLVGDNNSGMTSTALIVQAISTVAVASITAGYRFAVPLPRVAMERYLQVEYNVATAPFSAGGAVTTFLSDRPDDWTAYNQNAAETNSF